MVKMNEAFPSKYLKATDLQGREAQVVISSVDVEELNKERKLVMYFRGKEKGMVCNKTNANRIAFTYGDDTDGWIGRPIILYGEVVDFQGKATLGLRVRVPSVAASAYAPPEPTPTVQAASTPVAHPPADLNDEVPF